MVAPRRRIQKVRPIKNRHFAVVRAVLYGDLKPVDKLVLLAIESHADNKTGECFPGIRLIAFEAGLGRSTASKSISSMRKRGWLRVISGRLRGASNVYTVTPVESDIRERPCRALNIARQDPIDPARLGELRAMPYPEYLRSPEWQETRARALQDADFRCQVCYDDGRLDVHHRTYARVGCEAAGDVTVLCRTCHEKHHDRMPSAAE